MKILGAFGLTIATLFASSALAAPVQLDDNQLAAIVAGADFQVVGKIADQSGVAPVTDPDLVNPWGLASAPGGPLWAANNGTGTSTVYDNATFAKLALTVNIPAPGGGAGAPTGTVFTSLNGHDFMVNQGQASGHSIFLFATEDGTIVGWSPTVSQTQGVIAVDQSGQGAVFKGLSLWSTPGLDRLYAADFINNRVDVFDGNFHQVGSFTDTSLPAGYAPFNVQVLNHQVYVTFAKQGEGHDEAHGVGLGFVDVFNPAGHLVHRLVSNGPLNAPWGLTIAPPSFGKFAGALLVGNFGDGAVNAFDARTGAFLGQLKGPSGPISIDGLWALRNGPDGAVIFSSGPNDEANGLVGVIRPVWAPASWAFRDHVTH
jgi:uncharacterized protein (TIGR03118 family)